ncbi:MAG TPA: hypothetical protein VGG03_08075 [Thermoanaerobaculia bacterium]|jgi:hypothetical protein
MAAEEDYTDESDSADDVHGLEMVPQHRVSSEGTIVTGFNNIALMPGLVAGRDVHIVGNRRPHRPEVSEKEAFERIGAAVRLNLEQLERNIEQARHESSQFFRMTLILSALGFLIVLGGVALLLYGEVAAGAVTAAASVIPEVTAALFFNKDKELRRTIVAYHQHMIDSQQTLTMIDVAETIRNHDDRDRMKREIINKALGIGGIPRQGEGT